MSAQLHASARFTLGIRAPVNLWIGGWVGPRNGLDDVEKRTFLIIRYEGVDI
jgi:hypothetical protein